MTSTPDVLAFSAPAPTPLPSHAPTQRDELWVERAGNRQYTAYNGRGGAINVDGGPGDGAFTPGELLKLALAACAGLSSDVSLARRLGDDFDAIVHVAGAADRDEGHYPQLNERFEIDLSALAPDAAERLIALAARSIDRNCTVGRTLKAGSKVDLEIVDAASGRVLFTDASEAAPNSETI